MTVSSSGTGTIVLNAAVSGFLTFDLAGCSTASTGQLVNYAINDTAASEIGSATYFSSSKYLGSTPYALGTARVPDISTSGVGTPIAMSNAAQVFITPKAGDFIFVTPPQGRITLTSGTPVLSATVAGATTVLYTPYIGCSMPLFDGNVFVNMPFVETSQTTIDATKSPAAVAASSVYDLFAWLDTSVSPNVIRVTRGPAWSTTTTRGYTLTRQNGILLNTSAVTNGPAALSGTYVGTIASNAASTIDWIYGVNGAPPTAGSFNVWNAYNRVEIASFLSDTATNWGYSTNTWRAANGSATTRFTVVRGLDEDIVNAVYTAGFIANGTYAVTGVGVDSTTAQSGLTATGSGNVIAPLPAQYAGLPGIGSHFFQAIEVAPVGGVFFYGVVTSRSVFGLSIITKM